MSDESLFRVSVKALIANDMGQVLVVKEAGRTSWDLPGGGIDHGETIQEALARELKEEVDLQGTFNYEVIHVDNPHVLAARDIHQIRLIFRVMPETLPENKGVDADEIDYIDPHLFEHSEQQPERLIYRYSQLLQ